MTYLSFSCVYAQTPDDHSHKQGVTLSLSSSLQVPSNIRNPHHNGRPRESGLELEPKRKPTRRNTSRYASHSAYFDPPPHYSVMRHCLPAWKTASFHSRHPNPTHHTSTQSSNARGGFSLFSVQYPLTWIAITPGLSNGQTVTLEPGLCNAYVIPGVGQQ
jgi:hypothetical protein